VSEFWLDRWQEGRIGWHQPERNASLKKFWRSSGRRVLVPLCGKSPDIKWLADHGNEVIGVEISRLAIEAFFAENDIGYVIREGELCCYEASDASIKIFHGNYLDLNSIECDAHYDRGALIALPEDQRSHYAAHTTSLLTKDAEQLVVTLEYEQALVDGPPFSVLADEVLSYWPHLECVDEYDDIVNASPKFPEAGLTELIERVWRSA
jgi:thiopurine S-methyltransferase